MRWLAPIVIALFATRAAAAPRLAPQTEIGELAPTVSGGWLVTTAPAEAAYSFGRARLVADVTGTYRLALTWRRIDADVLTLEIWLPDDSVVLIKNGGIALFHDNASFAGFAALTARTQASSRIELVQTARTLEVSIDGVKVQQWPHPVAPAVGRIAVALKAAPRRRGRVRVTDLVIAPITQRQ